MSASRKILPSRRPFSKDCRLSRICCLIYSVGSSYKKAHRVCRSFPHSGAHWPWNQPHTRMGTPTPERKTAERKRERARRICPQVHGRDDSAANFKVQATLATRALASLRKAGTFRPESGGGTPRTTSGSLRAPEPKPAPNGDALEYPHCEVFHAIGAQYS
jgi:hypothetical protein